MLGTAQDQVRNVSLAAWMIRRHVDYVSKFRFQFRTAKDETDQKRIALDVLVNRIFSWHARPKVFDIAERFGREESFRMFEFEKATAGDVAFIKLPDLRLQAIESDLIAFPSVGEYDYANKKYGKIPQEVIDKVGKNTGLVMDREYPGRTAQYCICNRGGDGSHIAFDHLEDAENVIFDAYYTRFGSQVRGVSPLSTAINTIQDVYEGIDYALAKAKVHQLFGLAIMRDYYSAESDQEELYELGGASGVTEGTDEAITTATTTAAGTKKISTSLQSIKPGDMMLLDMDTKGKIDTIESKSPSAEFKDFTQYAIRIALLAFDIPFTALDSTSASFAGMIADQNLYEVSCKWKREKNLWKRQEYSDWVLETIWNDEGSDWPLRRIAQEAGFTSLRDLQEAVEWVPAGFPWLQKLNEVQGDIKAIAIGEDNPLDACKRRGSDFFDNILKTEQAYKFAKAHGVPLMIGEPGQTSVEEVSAGADKPQQ